MTEIILSVLAYSLGWAFFALACIIVAILILAKIHPGIAICLGMALLFFANAWLSTISVIGLYCFATTQLIMAIIFYVRKRMGLDNLPKTP